MNVVIYGDIRPLAETLLPLLWKQKASLALHTHKARHVYRQVSHAAPDCVVVLSDPAEPATRKLIEFLARVQVPVIAIGQPDECRVVETHLITRDRRTKGRILVANLAARLGNQLRKINQVSARAVRCA